MKAAFILGTSATMLTGCASKAPLESSPYALEFVASPNINPDAKNRPAPILIKLFELRSTGVFGSSNFFSLQDQAETTLGKDLVEMEQFVIRPGETKVIQRSGNSQVRSIGIMAEYRLLDSTRWRQSVTLPEPKQPGRFSFWQSQPDRLLLRVGVNKNGIDLLHTAQ